jgi:hypothetical protein
MSSYPGDEHYDYERERQRLLKHVGCGDVDNFGRCPDCNAIRKALRAAPAPTAGDVIEDLVVALRSLAYAAMTSGGTKGPDAGLQDAIRWATDALQKYDVSAQANGAAPAPEGETCEWTDDPSGWQTGCGRDWQFIDDGPVENRMDYCMGCGKRVRVVASEGEQP